MYNSKFSKVYALRIRKSGANSREETCWKLSQAEENIKDILVSTKTLLNTFQFIIQRKK